MNSMNTEFTIKNFRIFDSKGATFTVAPLTLLTGCNSAGKSSMVKAMLLLKNFFDQMRRDIDLYADCYPARYRLGVTNSNLKLGDFSSILNKDSKDNKITFAYTIKPQMAFEEFLVEYVFESNPKDDLNEGWLSDIVIRNRNKRIVYQIKIRDGQAKVHYRNLTLLKKSFSQFIVLLLDKSIDSYLYESHNIQGYEELNSKIETRTIEIYGEDFYKSLNEQITSPEKKDKILKVHIKKLQELKNIQVIWDKVRSIIKSIPDEEIAYFNDNYSHYPSNIKKLFTNKDDLFLFNNAFAIKSYLETDILCYFPLMHILDDVAKSQVRNILKSYPIYWDDEWEDIVEDFENSKYANFLDYYRHFEENDELRYRCWKNQQYKFSTGKNLKRDLIADSLYDMFENLRFIDEWDEDLLKTDRENETVARITFNVLSRLFWKTSFDLSLNPSDFIHIDEHWIDFEYTNHPIYNTFVPYVETLLFELILPNQLLTHFEYIGSSRVDVQRLYNVDSKEDSFGKRLTTYFTAKRNYKEDGYIVNTFLNKWIRAFGIGHSITLKNVEKGVGIVAYIHNDPEDVDGHLLADEGYGITQLFSILLEIETRIITLTNELDNSKMRDLYIGLKSGKINTKNGVIDFVLRAINDLDNIKDIFKKESIEPTYMISTIVIEEPEIHLHPRYQSLLAEMFMDAYKNYNIHFIIETHSEYLIRKLQTLIAKPECELNNDDVAIHYISKEASQRVKRIGIQDDGRLETPFGAGFFDEADNLAMELLTIKWM